MSLYDLHKLLFDVHSDPKVRDIFLSDPETLFSRYTLSEDELAALRAKDIYRLYKRGVNVYLLALFLQLLGFPLAELSNILRAGAEAERQQQSP
jgi:hypothetical protein